MLTFKEEESSDNQGPQGQTVPGDRWVTRHWPSDRSLALADERADVASFIRVQIGGRGPGQQIIAERGVRFKAYQADVAARERGPDRMVGAVLEDLGHSGVFWSITPASPVTQRSSRSAASMWDEVLGVNLNGLFNVCHAVLPTMVGKGGGRIVNLASIVGQRGKFGQANYAVTKGGTSPSR